MPDAEMNALGQQAFAQIRQEEPIETDPTVNAYVSCVTKALLSQVERDTSWEVVVFDEDETINAFALPGGRIGVYTGMLTVADTPEQLATVVAHEIGHVLARHSAERVSQQVALGAGLDLASVALQDVGQRRLLLGALGVGAQLGVVLPYSRKHESEADELGQQLMAEAGFDPRASVTLWQDMARASGEGPPEFLSTHPSHETRVRQLQATMDDALATYREALSEGQSPMCRPPEGERASVAPPR